MSRSISVDGNLGLFPQALATLADTTALLLQIDCQGEHAPPRVDFLLLLSIIRRELEVLLCAILRPEQVYSPSSLQFFEKYCCNIILRGCNTLVELLRRRLQLYIVNKEPVAPSWSEICSFLTDYRMHLLPLSGNLKEDNFADWPTFLKNFETDASNARSHLETLCRRQDQAVSVLEPAEPVEPVELEQANGSVDMRTPLEPTKASNESATPYEVGLREGKENERKRLLDSLDTIGLFGESAKKKTTLLLKAVKQGSVECVQLLIDKGARVNGTTAQGEDLPLIAAVRGGNAEVTKVLLQNGARIHERDSSGISAILAAAETGNIVALKVLLENEANIEELTTSEPGPGYTPLMVAVSSGHLGTVKFLVEKKADTSVRSAAKESLLGLAIQKGHMGIIRYLLDKNIGIDATDNDGNNALHLACQKGMKKIAELLICKRELLLQVPNGKSETALHVAVREKKEAIVILLLQKGAQVDAATKFKKTPLHYAVKSLALNITKDLIERGAKLDLKDKSRKTPLHHAIDLKSQQIVQLLLEKGASATIGDKDKRTPLHYAVLSQSQHTALIDLIIAKLRNTQHLDARDNDGNTPLHHAVNMGKISVVQKLLAAGARMDIANNNGVTAPEHTLKMPMEDEGSSLLLLEHFLRYHQRGHAFTATVPILSMAASKDGKLAHIRKLLDHDPGLVNQVPDPDNKYSPALHEAIKAQKIPVVREFCSRRGVNLTLQDHSGNTPLHQAILSGDETMVSLLVNEFNVSVEKPNSKTGLPPLHFAAQRQELGIVKILVRKGARAIRRVDGEACRECQRQPGDSKRKEGMNARCLLQKIPTEERKLVAFLHIDALLLSRMKDEKAGR